MILQLIGLLVTIKMMLQHILTHFMTLLTYLEKCNRLKKLRVTKVSKQILVEHIQII